MRSWNPYVYASRPHSRHSRPRLTELSLRDAHRLGRRLEGARKIRKPEARAAVLAEIEAEVAKAEQRIGERRARVPAVTYPEQLPVSQKKDEIAAAIRDHQVVIVAGETGSGRPRRSRRSAWSWDAACAA